MPKKRRRYSRPPGRLPYRKLFVIATEGSKTEHQYFLMFNNKNSTIQIRCLPKGLRSDPENVLKAMTDYIKESGLKKSDEAWLVVDKDNWKDTVLNELYNWSLKAKNYKLALSNPKFEYWLLLHFENGDKIVGSDNCSKRLKPHLPSNNKNINPRNFTKERIHDAIRRAKLRDKPQCVDWPRNPGCTTVYRLVENILSA